MCDRRRKRVTDSLTHGPASGESGLYQDPNLAVSPTALEAATAITGIIVSDHVQQITPRLAERDHRRRISAEGCRVFRFHFLHLGPGLIERHYSRSAIFRPPQRHRRTEVPG